MLNELNFKEVCKFLKKDDSSLIEAVDKLSGAAMLLSALALGPQAPLALGLLGAKNELTKIGKHLVEKVTSKTESDYLARMQRMQIAYGLICITAFFEALDQLMPNELRSKIALISEEKTYLMEEAGKHFLKSEEGRNTSKILKEGVENIPLIFPHPTIPFEKQQETLGQIYQEMSICLDGFIKKLAVWEKADESVTDCIKDTIAKLPKQSLECFEGQYLELARKYPDFYIWSQFNERKAIQKQIMKIDNYLDRYNSQLSNNGKKIDIGFEKLHETVLSIPDQFKKIEAREVVDGLQRYYEARINEPIIEDEFTPDDNKPSLNFPKISEAFIPQSYQVIRKTEKEKHLEREETWANNEISHDLGVFLLKYLHSPYSIETPLLILGHPGIGKSLLTKVLCARLMSNAYTVVRVPLREVDSDMPVETQVETIITRTTGQKLSSWANFSSQFSDKPLVIILDGYDELLQASGKVYAGFLTSIQQFQKREIEQRRPVRVIVTSRITLIDKTSIPEGSTILRLLEFNEEQRNKWIQVWNKANKEYFNSCDPAIEPFSITTDEAKGKNDKILSLAEQPLLLLMLALYDSDGNRLRQQRGIDRTLLYDSLLRRFVERERRRYIKDFDHLNNDMRQKEIDREMLRLSAVAIGMYNRRQLYILSSELATDLKFFKLERQMTIADGRPMTEEDLLLGSFFFIHKSETGQQGEGQTHTVSDTAFEFLHNTFGEFLTATFILTFVFQEADAIYKLKDDEGLQSVLQQKINTPDGLAEGWFACLMHAPLHSRPVVLEMLREWTSHLLEQKRRSRADFLSSLDEILKSQISMILRSTSLPVMLRNEGKNFADISLLGHIAIYTLNLIVVRTVLDEKEFVFDEICYSPNENIGDCNASETRAWDKLTHIWRSWFFLDNLNALSTILSAKREHSKIRLTSNKSFQIRPSKDRLDIVLSVATTLSDNIVGGLAGLLTPDSEENSSQYQYLAEMQEKLKGENIDLNLEFIVRRLRICVLSRNVSVGDLVKLLREGFHEALAKKQRSALVAELFNLTARLFHLQPLLLYSHREIKDLLLHPGFFGKIMEMGPGVAIEWLRLVKELGAISWLERYGERFFESAFHPRYVEEIMEMGPGVAIEWLRLAKELGDTSWLERYGEEFFETAFHPRYFEKIMEMGPGVAFEWLRLTKELGATSWLERYGERFFETYFHPRYFEKIMDMRPEIAFELLRLAKEVGATSWLERYGERFFETSFHSRYFEKIMKMRPEIAFELLRLGRELGATSWLKRYDEEFFEVFKQAVGSNLSKIPLGHVPDIQWYAKITNNEELIINLQKYMDMGD